MTKREHLYHKTKNYKKYLLRLCPGSITQIDIPLLCEYSFVQRFIEQPSEHYDIQEIKREPKKK